MKTCDTKLDIHPLKTYSTVKSQKVNHDMARDNCTSMTSVSHSILIPWKSEWAKYLKPITTQEILHYKHYTVEFCFQWIKSHEKVFQAFETDSWWHLVNKIIIECIKTDSSLNATNIFWYLHYTQLGKMAFYYFLSFCYLCTVNFCHRIKIYISSKQIFFK